MDEYSNILKRHCLKVTPQRVAILEHLMNSHSHPTAEMIFNDLIKLYPSMSLATVYKTLDTLKNEALILEINMGESSNRYDCNTTPHAHFMCYSCTKVIDIEIPSILEQIGSEVSESYNVSVLGNKTFFYGYCQGCKCRQCQ